MVNPTPRELYVQLARRGKEVKCLSCEDLVLPQKMVKHMSEKHSDVGNACPWCWTETFQYKNHKYYLHLLRCLRIAKLAVTKLEECEYAKRLTDINRDFEILSEKYKPTEKYDVKNFLKQMNAWKKPNQKKIKLDCDIRPKKCAPPMNEDYFSDVEQMSAILIKSYQQENAKLILALHNLQNKIKEQAEENKKDFENFRKQCKEQLKIGHEF